ncbi:MAG: ABC transporter ATP-binding protein [Bacteroidetes bacterium]|nr:ABC transporter ATP-binding protein [Bacteroidota bacterium]
MGKILMLIAERKLIFFLALGVTLMVAWVTPQVPKTIMRMIDEAVVTANKALLVSLTLWLLAYMVIQTLATYYQTYLTNLLGQDAVMALRMKVFKHIMRYKTQVFDRTPIGTLITRTVSDVEKVADIFAQGLIAIIGDFLQMFFILAMLFAINWKLSLVVLVSFPFLLVSGWVFKEAVKDSFREVRNQIARLNAFLQEHITGMQIVQLFNRQREEYERFKQISKEELKANLKAVLSYSIFFPVIEILQAISLAALVWYWGKQSVSGMATFGEITAVILLVERLFRPIRQIADKFNTLQMGMVSSERIYQLLDDHRFLTNDGHITSGDVKGNVRMENVHFSYVPGQEILKGINLEVKEGQMLAIVGHTGAGKTTIINLINRLYDIQEGSIYLDGEPIQSYELSFLRKNVAVVLQDVFLFSDTIANNISLYNPEICQDDIERISKQVGSHDFINSLPNGYCYEVQERGASLSTGQRQLISFLRALAANPRVLILDEATSSVDQETEEMLQQATDFLLKGRTSIVIAHRLSTIRRADKIVVMEKGQIAETGTHAQLMAQDGLYRKLYELQFAD